jgi:hypothetical protein
MLVKVFGIAKYRTVTRTAILKGYTKKKTMELKETNHCWAGKISE